MEKILHHRINYLNRAQAHEAYIDLLADAHENGEVPHVMAWLGRNDLFFLLVNLLHREDVDNDWLFERVVEVNNNPDGHLDLWARDHYKSTIITFGLTIKDILNHPDWTFGIFSHTRPIAKGFLRQIKLEFEGNELLKETFPDVLYKFPKKQSPKWSEDDGIVVRRKTNPKEATVEAWGLVDGQPTSKHYKRIIYDDVVTLASVTTTEQIKKVTNAWENSQNLIDSRFGRFRGIGTRYNFNDTYKTMMDRTFLIPRVHAATDDGTSHGNPVFLTPEQLESKRSKMGPYVFACQMLQNPKEDSIEGFDEQWLRYWKVKQKFWETMNIYIICDPAGSKKKKDNDYTVMLVVGLNSDQKYYLIDGVRDRLNLTERTERIIKLHKQYRPVAVAYEQYGKDSDIEHIEYMQQRINYRFEIIPVGSLLPKLVRIKKLIPVFEQKRFFLPQRLLFKDCEDQMRDLVAEFINEEYTPFPAATKDDIFDCLSQILDGDLMAEFPEEEMGTNDAEATESYDPLSYGTESVGTGGYDPLGSSNIF